MKIHKKNAIKSRAFHNLQSHLACQYIKMCILFGYTFFESFVKIYFSKRKCHFCVIFFQTALYLKNSLENLNAGHVRII